MNKQTKRILTIIAVALILYWVYATYFIEDYKYADEGVEDDSDWLDDMYGGGGYYAPTTAVSGDNEGLNGSETAGTNLPEGLVSGIFSNWVGENPDAWAEYVQAQEPSIDTGTGTPPPPVIVNPTGLTSTGVAVPSINVTPRFRGGGENLAL